MCTTGGFGGVPSTAGLPVGQDEGVTDESSEPRFLRLRDVALELGCTEGQIYSLVRSGELQGIQIGGRNQWRVERSKLEEYIEVAYRRTAENLERSHGDDADGEASDGQ